MSSNKEIIQEFIKAWSNLDAAELTSYFTSDGVYHNIPAQPVVGNDNLQKFIAGFIAPWTDTEWELLNIVEAGNIVIAERLDKTKAGDKQVDLPCCGVFEMRDGKIAVWRDYFDMQTYINAMS